MNKEKVGSVWSLAADLGSGRQISVSWNMPEESSLADLNGMSDLFRSALDRQQAKTTSYNLNDQINDVITKKKQIIDTIAKLDSKSDAKGGMSVAERNQRDAALSHLANLSVEIEEKQKLLERLREEAK